MKRGRTIDVDLHKVTETYDSVIALTEGLEIKRKKGIEMIEISTMLQELDYIRRGLIASGIVLTI